MNDKLVSLVIRALGLDPDTLQTQLVALQNWVVNSIRNLDARLRAMEADRVLMHEKLDFITEQNRQLLALLRHGGDADERPPQSPGPFGTLNGTGLYGPLNGTGPDGTGPDRGNPAGPDGGNPAAGE